jgi:phosphatidylinositol/phosphatidylcholine transfer protein
MRDLNASKWVLQTAIHRLEETLKWRREYGVYDITAEHVEPEVLLQLAYATCYLIRSPSGGHRQGNNIWLRCMHVVPFCLNCDDTRIQVTGRPALYLIPSRQNTNNQTRQIQFTVWMLERCVDLMDPGVGYLAVSDHWHILLILLFYTFFFCRNLALLINFADRAKNPSLGTARKVLNILQCAISPLRFLFPF